MAPEADPPRVRRQLGLLLQRRARIEKFLLTPRSYLHATLIKRFLGTRDRKRSSPAYYLVRTLAGRSRFRHVPARDLEKVRAEVEAFHSFSEKLAELRDLFAEILDVLRSFMEAQEDKDHAVRHEPGSEDRGGSAPRK
jgi:hypothetical protein